MQESLKVVVVLARCSRTLQGFGIRFEQANAGQWSANWSFAIKLNSAKREGYDREAITGGFQFDPAYPGCPHCRAANVFKCGCGKVGCWDGESRTVTCPWCRSGGELRGYFESLSAAVDG